MDNTEYKQQLERAQRCVEWMNLETTSEFLEPLREKLRSLKDINYEDILQFDDKSFRSKVEGAFLAAKEIEDYFQLLETIKDEGKYAQKALSGKLAEEY